MLREWLPYSVFKVLFGDRQRYGKQAWDGDPDWQKWLSLYPTIYQETQRSSWLATRINQAGYAVLSSFDLDGLDVAEMGPGGGYHFDAFRGVPRLYSALDVCPDFFEALKQTTEQRNIPTQCLTLAPYTPHIPLPSDSQDLLFSFYSLEHLHPLEAWVSEIFRVLKPGGALVGAIPTEGGLLWGLGRYVTSYQHLKRKYDLDMKKIVCWEHPNMCDDIMNVLAQHSTRIQTNHFPIPFLPRDLSLVMTLSAYK